MTVLFSDAQISSVITSVTPIVIIVAIAVAIVTSMLLIEMLRKFAGSRRIVTAVLISGILAIISGAVSVLTGVSG